MNEKENNKTALLKPRYAKWHDTKGGCVEDWMEIFADDIDFRSLAMGTGSGATFTTPCCSKDDLRSYFNGLLGGWNMVHYTIEQYVEQGDLVCAIGSTSWTNKQTGKTIDTPKVDVWRFKDGKAVAFFEYYDTAALRDASEP